MILYDMHVHTKGISKCSLLSPEQLCDALKNEGTGGFVLTNHYGKRHCDMDFPLWLEKYRDEFYRVKEIAAKRGLRALFGIEVTLGSQDFLLYGVTPDSLFHSGSRPLWAFSLKELSDFAHSEGGLLIHAHPFRHKGTPADYTLLDGLEINCHPLYHNNWREEARQYADAHGLILTCGSDYHGDIYKAHCGVYLPERLQTETELGEYLRRGQPPLLLHDIDIEKALATQNNG